MDIFENIDVFEIELGFNSRPQIHKHCNHEFFFCAGGSGTQLLKDRTVKMGKGGFFFFPEGQLHMGNGDRDEKCVGLVLNVKESLLLRLAENEYEFGRLFSTLKRKSLSGRIRISLAEDATVEIEGIYRELIDEKKNRRPWCNLAAKSLLQRFLVTVVRGAKLGRGGNMRIRASSEDKIREVCRFIDANYMYRINVAQIAKFAGLSRSHFHAVFNRITGKTLVRQLNGIRVGKAIEMLRNTETGIEDIASSCGFTSLSHFYLVFRKETGKSPGDFR